MCGIFSKLSIFLAIITGVFAGDFCYTNDDGFKYCFGQCCDFSLPSLTWRYCCNGGSINGGAMIGIGIAYAPPAYVAPTQSRFSVSNNVDLSDKSEKRIQNIANYTEEQ
ncbi:hypothetical protein MAR_032065, partial [Mya arenaria]